MDFVYNNPNLNRNLFDDIFKSPLVKYINRFYSFYNNNVFYICLYVCVLYLNIFFPIQYFHCVIAAVVVAIWF